MKLAEYAKLWRLKTDLDWREHFDTNKFTGKGPVAITSCTDCDETLDYADTVYHTCVKVQERINTQLGHVCTNGTPWRECDRCVEIYTEFSKSNLTRTITSNKENK